MSRRALLISLEFEQSTVFSGNGVLARTYAHELATGASNIQLDVLCARPVTADGDDATTTTPTVTVENNNTTVIIAVPVPASKWRKLDRGGPWAEMREATMRHFAPVSTRTAAENFQVCFDREKRKEPARPYDFIFFIDWHGFLSYEQIADASRVPEVDKPATTATTTSCCRLIFLNFRIFCNRLLGDINSEEYQFYRQHEVQANAKSDVTFVLADTDKKLLQELCADDVKQKPIHILVPPLQPAVLANLQHLESEQQSDDHNNNFYLTSVNRLDPTKGVDKFVDVVEQLALKRRSSSSSPFSLCPPPPSDPSAVLIPFLCGAEADKEYALAVKEKLRRVTNNNCVIESFVTPVQLMTMFHSKGILNVHCPGYDAYGMTLTEASAVGCLTLCHGTQHNTNAAESDEQQQEEQQQQHPVASPLSLCTPKTPGSPSWSSPVGAASNLLEWSNDEVILCDFERISAAQIAAAIEPILVKLLDHKVRMRKQNDNASAAATSDVERWIENARTRALSYTPPQAIERLLRLSSCEP